MTRHSDVVIIGGGISGLSSAWWLARSDIKSIVLEKSERIGGLINTTQKDGYTTEHAASMVLNFNASVKQLISESGLTDKQRHRNKISERYILKNDKLTRVPSTVHGLMMSDLFSFKARLKLLKEPFSKASQSESESVAQFIRRRVGQDILDLAIDPYVSAVLACDPEKACARSTLPRLTALEKRFGSFTAGILAKKLIPGKKGLPQEAFTFEPGMAALTDTLADDPSIDVQTGQQVISLSPLKSGWQIISQHNGNETEYHARQIIFSTPANITSHLVNTHNSELSALLDQIEYAGMAQIHMGFDQSAFTDKMSGNGFLVPSRAQVPIRGSLWMSNLVDNRAPAGKILTSNFIGGAMQPDALKKSDQQLCDDTLSALHNLCGLKQSPEMVRINRHHQGLPLYHGAYYQLTRAINTVVANSSGLHLLANYQGGISVRDRIIEAQKIADRVSQSLASRETLRSFSFACESGANF